MSNALFSFSKSMVSGKPRFDINWVNRTTDSRVFKKLYHWIRNSHDYSPRCKSSQFTRFIEKTNKSYKSSLSMDEALAIRNIVIKDKIIKNYGRMNKEIDKITEKYNAGTSILKISELYDFPPLNLLRGVFIHRGLNSKDIYSVFAEKKKPETILKGRDLTQFKLARDNDAESTFNQKQIADIAMDNEMIVVDFFKQLGIAIQTQDDLVKDQVAKFGRAMLTPDILFIDEVYINKSRVHWIDYKDYIGTNIRFLYDSNVAQSVKYAENWGPGALCYHRSFVEGLVIPGSILLDARSLPVKYKIVK